MTNFLLLTIKKNIQFALFYPIEFSTVDIMGLDSQLGTSFINIHSHHKFLNIKRLAKRRIMFIHFIFLMVILDSIFPVTTFSTMKIVKTFEELNGKEFDE